MGKTKKITVEQLWSILISMTYDNTTRSFKVIWFISHNAQHIENSTSYANGYCCQLIRNHISAMEWKPSISHWWPLQWSEGRFKVIMTKLEYACNYLKRKTFKVTVTTDHQMKPYLGYSIHLLPIIIIIIIIMTERLPFCFSAFRLHCFGI